MPIGLRDPAVVAVGGQLVIAGGMTAKGPSKALYGFDPRTNQVAGIAPLPTALAHAQAVVLHGRVYLIGGQVSAQGSQTDAILDYDPVTAHITSAGRLPTPLSDAGLATLGDQVVVAGGIDDAGQLHQEVWLSAPSG
jgi:N-acetylneuraminic acid mutarotase